MSQEITEAFVKQFSANVFHLSQQKGTRLQPFVRNESQRGKAAFYERLGSVEAQPKTGRHANTPQIDTPHSRRMVTLVDYNHADLIDSADRIRTLIDPTSPYSAAFAWALGRAKDVEIITNGLGIARAGEEGGVEVPLPNEQKYAANDGTNHTNLNVRTLRAVKQKFDENDVDESIPRYIACTASQINALLGEKEVTSADYNVIRALVAGQVDTFMGFRFVRLEKLPLQSGALDITPASGEVGTGGGDADGSRRVMAWAQDGILMSTGMDVRGRISERDDKNYSTQVYAEMAVGAVRMEEEKVVEILCKE